MSGIRGRGGRKRIHTDQELREACDRVWANGQGRWPNEENIGLKASVERVVAQRYEWAEARGYKVMTADQAKMHNMRRAAPVVVKGGKLVREVKPVKVKPKRPRTEWGMISHIIRRMEQRG